MSDKPLNPESQEKRLAYAKRFQVNFTDSNQAKALESFIATIQNIYGIRKKSDAVSLMLQLAQKQFSREDVIPGKISFRDKHYTLLEIHVGNLIRAFKAALDNAGFQGIKQIATDSIEALERENRIKTERLAKENLEFHHQIQELKKSNDSLVKKNRDLQKAFAAHEAAWNQEKKALMERIQKDNINKESTKSVIDTTDRTVSKLKKKKNRGQ